MSSENDKPPVVKLAQPGFNVRTAGDENLIYHSSWPLLKIYKEGSYSTSEIGTRNVIAEHDLGFTPMFWYFANTPINAWANFLTAGQTNRSEFMGFVGDGSVEIGPNKLLFEPVSAFPGVTGRSRLYYYIFAIDLAKEFLAPIIKVGDVSGARTSGPVFKLAKEGKSVFSHDLMDFVIHSQARSPLIHSVNPSPGNVKEFRVSHGLGYLPMFFGYEKTDRGTYKSMPTGQGGSSSFQSDEQSIVFADSGGKELTIVVLKDPFQVRDSVSVTV